MNEIACRDRMTKFRILVIDDNRSIHEDFLKILGSSTSMQKEELDDFATSLLGVKPDPARDVVFEIDSAFQGQEGLEKVRAAAAEGRPYSLAFVDVRMPPGWDGIETITHISREFTDLQFVICTAYSDYSWNEIAKTIGNTDNVLLLKKPFDNLEVTQMAHALGRKWELTQMARQKMDDLENRVSERTAELRAVNKELTSEVVERTMAETALRNSEERFSMAFHGSPVPMAIRRLDVSGCVDANASFLTLLSASREEALAEGALQWTDSTIEGRIESQLDDRHPVRDLPASIRTVAGETRQVLVTAQILKLGDAPYQLLILQDVTERTRLENDLRQAQKMEAIGRLAAGVAHDFNNILTVILGNTTMQLDRPQLDDDLTGSLRQVVAAAERATALTRQLLAYSRKQVLARRPLRLDEIVEQTADMLRRIIGEHISIEVEIAPDLPPIFADATSVDQVIMNLALNSRDAMPDGGRLTIQAFAVELDKINEARQPNAKPGSYVCLSMKDDGEGMDKPTLERVFEPFFTTKELGKGTGMGLATVYGVLQQHDGWIEVDSTRGIGTEVRVFFPASETGVVEERGTRITKAVENAVPAGFTILVVEDEQMLREFVCNALTSIGYRVLSAANGQEALKIWEAHREEIDLLLTDVVMPGLPSGRQLEQQLTSDKPDLKVIFTSGYSEEVLGMDSDDGPRHGFLAKPYFTESLARTVATQLCESARQSIRANREGAPAIASEA
jgi:two-component system cell cycle sensor histidine kinase/response regulator CckA